jgi:single-strand DNA-binding protein
MWQQLILVGNLGRDPELRYTPTGTAVCDFSVAVNRQWKDRESDEQHKETTWFRVTAWRELAETCAQYLSKGRQVMVVGRVDASPWIGNDGQPRATLEVRAHTVRFLGGRADTGAPGEAGTPPAEEEEIPF